MEIMFATDIVFIYLGNQFSYWSFSPKGDVTFLP